MSEHQNPVAAAHDRMRKLTALLRELSQEQTWKDRAVLELCDLAELFEVSAAYYRKIAKESSANLAEAIENERRRCLGAALEVASTLQEARRNGV